MKRSRWSVLACLIALIGMTACSSTDDVITNLPASQQAEAALESAFVEVIAPLSDFMEGMADAVFAGQPKAVGLVCPSSENVCSSGSVACDEDSSGVGLDFDFDNCNLSDAMILVDGGVSFTAVGETSFLVTFLNFSVDGSSPITGTVGYDGSTCTQDWAITTADGVGVLGSITGCDSNPSANSSLAITVVSGGNVWFFGFDFDGSGLADVIVERNEELVSICSIDLDTFEATCFNPDDV